MKMNPTRTNHLFAKHRKLLIGVVHLKPLPGSPRWGGDFAAVINSAVADASRYESGGAHALIIENFGNVLRNDASAALALCAACHGSFIRVNVHSGAMLTDQGLIEGNAFETLRYRKRICPGALIFADVHVKHAVPLGNWTLEAAARDTLERGLADALIVSGAGTGLPTNAGDLELVRAACPSAKVLLGSGVSFSNVGDYLHLADGFIVGTSLKVGGKVPNAVDPKRVAALAKKLGI